MSTSSDVSAGNHSFKLDITWAPVADICAIAPHLECSTSSNGPCVAVADLALYGDTTAGAQSDNWWQNCSYMPAHGADYIARFTNNETWPVGINAGTCFSETSIPTAVTVL